jgi:hypothetical protein
MAAREVWARRVRRWVESDLTAAEFASELGINPRTLTYWKWKLGKEGRETKVLAKRSESSRADTTTFVEVTPPASTWWQATDRLEVVVGDGLVIRVPEEFEVETLRRVVQALRKVEGEE